MLAWTIDILIRLAINGVFYAALAFFGKTGLGIALILTFLLEWFYPVYFELFKRGQTPGKKMFNLYVTMDDASPISPGASIIRNLLRFVDFLPLLYGFGFISMLLTKRFQRLGDLVAGTVVLHKSLDYPKLKEDQTQAISTTIREEWKIVSIAAALFYLPFIAIIIVIQFFPDLVFSVMDSGMVNSLESMYEPERNQRLGRERESDTDLYMFGYYIKHNIGIDFKMFAGGLLFGIGAIFFLVFNGIFLGSAFGHMTHIGYIDSFWGFVVGHGAFELNAMVLSGAAGLKLAEALIRPGRKTRARALIDNGKIAVLIMYGVVVMSLIAAFLEAFWSSTIMPVMIKYIAGAILWTVVASFALYINRRTQLEAWDIELDFKKLAIRFENIAKNVLPLVLCVAAFSLILSPSPAIAENNQSNANEIKATEFLSDELGYTSSIFKEKSKKESYQAPEVMFGMDVRPESLPDDIIGESRKLWENKQHREALSLLYRGALIRLINQEQVQLKDSYTEGDVLRHSKTQITELKHAFLKDLTSNWKLVAYAHKNPSDTTMEQLFSTWLSDFAINKPDLNAPSSPSNKSETHEKKERTIHTGLFGEARTNPLYAGRVFLKRMGIPTETKTSVQGFTGYPSTDTVIVINSKRTTLSALQTQALVNWVKKGGHVIALATNKWRYHRAESQSDDDGKLSGYKSSILDERFTNNKYKKADHAEIFWYLIHGINKTIDQPAKSHGYYSLHADSDPLFQNYPKTVRSLTEHIKSSGVFYWKHNQKQQLLESTRQTVKQQLGRAHPNWNHLDEKQQVDLLFKDLEKNKSLRLNQEQIHHALFEDNIEQADDFTNTIRTLEAIRLNKVTEN
ncbi:hypothetical protein GQR58_006816 [Nymphon striatum]|nr:hypothetical protein GQR58_006816 [Nymphon striatum]